MRNIRFLAVFIILLAMVGIGSAQDGAPCTPKIEVIKNNPSAKTEKPIKTDNVKCCSQEVTVNVNEGKSSDEDCSTKKIKYDSDKGPSDSGNTGIYTFLLVVVGVFTAGILIWQACETRKSANAARVAAQAAQKSADAQVRSIRAWMVSTSPSLVFNAVGNKVMQVHFHCRIFNSGKTPARILEICINFKTFEGSSKIPNMPRYDVSKAVNYSEILVPPMADVPMFGAEFDMPKISDDEWKEIQGGNSLALICGYVKYLDTASIDSTDVRETRFCYACEPGMGIRPCVEAPPEYHKAT